MTFIVAPLLAALAMLVGLIAALLVQRRALRETEQGDTLAITATFPVPSVKLK